MKQNALKLLVLLLCTSLGYSNEVFTEVGIDAVKKSTVKGEQATFGGTYVDAGAQLYAENFWVDGRIRLDLYSTDSWKTASVGLITDKSHINLGFNPWYGSEFIVGTDYDAIFPGAYMYAYNDISPNGRYGNTGLTYHFLWLKDIAGLTFATNLPMQKDMFKDDNGMEMNFAMFYQSILDLNMGLRFHTNYLKDFGFGTGISGGLNSIFSWNVGYSYNGEGLNKNVAEHYFDGSTNLIVPGITISLDMEWGLNDQRGMDPLYVGTQFAVTAFDYLIPKLTLMYNVEDTKEIVDCTKSVLINPRLLYERNNYRISVGAEILYITTDGKESQVGLNVPIYLKYWYEK